jgi:hypothetical protein
MPITTLLPNGTIANPNGTLTGGATLQAVLDELINAHDSDSSYNSVTSAGGDTHFICNVENLPGPMAISGVTVRWVHRVDGGATHTTKALVRISGSDYYGSDVTLANSTYVTSSYTWVLNPATGLAWTQSDVDNAGFGVRQLLQATANHRYTALNVDVSEGAAAQLDAARIIGSRRIRYARRTLPVLEIEAPLLFADLEIGDAVMLSHIALPMAAAYPGWERWKRALCRVIGSDIGDGSVRLSLVDVRDYAVRLWDTAQSDEAPTAGFGSGVCRLTPGGTRTFSRGSSKYVNSPADESLLSHPIIPVIQCGSEVEAILFDGTLLEAEGTNHITRSSFVSGTTGLTLAGTGVNGSAIAADTTDLLFDSTITANSLKFTAGNPHTTELSARFPDTASIPANSQVVVSVDHKDDSGATLYWRLQRLVDNWYWNAGGSAWQSGTVDNAFTVRTSLSGAHRDYGGISTVGAGATALRLYLLQQSGGTASRVNRAYHVQIEIAASVAFPSSRIVCNGTEVTRSADLLKYTNDSGKRTWDSAQGTAFARFIPYAPYATTAIIYLAYWDSNNWHRLARNGSNWEFRVKVSGTEYTATKGISAYAWGATYDIACRWCGSEGELGLAPYTISVFVDGVKGTDAVASGAATMTSPAYLYCASEETETSGMPGAMIAQRLVSPFVLSDAEIADLP